MARQHGFTLLLLLLLLLVSGTAVFLAVREPGAAQRAKRVERAMRALGEARETLIARALADQNRPGSLPCAAPDTGGSGTFSGNDCDADAGRFPYRTLDTRALRGAADVLLWYVLDPALRDRLSQQPVNPQAKQGALSLDGRDHYAAVIVAAGDTRPGQAGRPSNDRDDYLEGGNETGSDFTDCTGAGGCNDLVRGITVDALFDGVQERVLEEVAAALRDLWESSDADPAQRYLPNAAAFGDTECDTAITLGRIPTTDADLDCGGAGRVIDPDADLPPWIGANGWLGLVVYHVDPQCTLDERNCAAASLSLDAAAGLQAVVAGAGRALPVHAQTRPGTDVGDYLDAAENADADPSYAEQPLAPDDNDVLRGVRVP